VKKTLNPIPLKTISFRGAEYAALVGRPIKMPRHQYPFMEKVGGKEGRSCGLRRIIESYMVAEKKLPFADLPKVEYEGKLPRTSYRMTKTQLDFVSTRAENVGYAVALRRIVQAAMEGKFDLLPLSAGKDGG
jgi:hypothetical protein